MQVLFSDTELKEGASWLFGAETKRNSSNMTNNASVTSAYNDAAVVAAVYSGTATNVMTRIHNQQRKTYVRDAIRAELAHRMNRRIEMGMARPGDRPRIPQPHLDRAMEHARNHARLAAEFAGACQ
jgi:hypothetical protein